MVMVRGTVWSCWWDGLMPRTQVECEKKRGDRSIDSGGSRLVSS